MKHSRIVPQRRRKASISSAVVFALCTSVLHAGAMQNSRRHQRTSPTAPDSVTTWQHSLSPVASGKGLVVCEPQGTTGTDTATLELGAACARWLLLHVGGLPALDKTPDWIAPDRVAHEQRWPSLRLSLSQALLLTGRVGATHVAVGQVEGTSAHMTLHYRLYAVQGARQVGSPLLLTGTADEIVAHLPDTARQMAVRLHIPTAALPAQVGVKAARLRLLGRWSACLRTRLQTRSRARYANWLRACLWRAYTMS